MTRDTPRTRPHLRRPRRIEVAHAFVALATCARSATTTSAFAFHGSFALKMSSQVMETKAPATRTLRGPTDVNKPIPKDRLFGMPLSRFVKPWTFSLAPLRSLSIVTMLAPTSLPLGLWKSLPDSAGKLRVTKYANQRVADVRGGRVISCAWPHFLFQITSSRSSSIILSTKTICRLHFSTSPGGTCPSIEKY